MFTIDLAREIDHISSRQHLNAVQDLVLLVRRALRAGATEVRITRRRDEVTIVSDGDPVPDDERALLFSILGASDDDVKHASLGKLEREHGIALLSLFVTKASVTVRSRVSFHGGSGRITHLDDRDDLRTTISYTRPSSLKRAEKRELAFYARCADVPIFVDGRALERAPVISMIESRAILGARLAFDDDEIHCTLIDKNQPTRIRYLDHGIFFGVRARSPDEPVPIDVVVNTRARAYDENYRAVVERSQSEVLRAEREALSLLARHPGPLDDDRRQRVRAIVIDLKKESAPPALFELPLYETVGGGWWSTNELTRVVRHRGLLHYVRPRDVVTRKRTLLPWRGLRKSAPVHGDAARVPILDDREAHSVARALHVEARRTPIATPSKRVSSTTVPAGLDDPPAPLAAFLTRLNAHSTTRFRCIAGAQSKIDDNASDRVVGLAMHDPVVHRALLFATARPDLIAVAAARLIGHAREVTAGHLTA